MRIAIFGSCISGAWLGWCALAGAQVPVPQLPIPAQRPLPGIPAQIPNPAQRILPAQGGPLPGVAPAPAFISRSTGPLSLTQISVAGGRVEVNGAYGGRGGTSTSSSSGGSRTERTSVDLTGAFPRIDYSLTMADRKVAIQASDKNRFSLKRETVGEDSPVIPVEYVQNAGEPVTLSWGAGNERRTVRASGLWHLALLEPEVCRLQLFPLLETIKPRWDLQITAEKTIQLMCNESTLQQTPQRRRWSELIVQMGEERYFRRQQAYDELMLAGQSARPFLEAVDRDPLDAEQRHRLRMILKFLAPDSSGDSPEQNAILLAADPRAWFGLLRHAELEKRRIAAAQLASLLGDPIDFDPAADSEKRTAQWEKLRPLVERPVLVASDRGTGK